MNAVKPLNAYGRKKPRNPMANVLLPDFSTMEGSVLTPIRKMKSMKPNSANVSKTPFPLAGNTLDANLELRPRIEGPRMTPP